MSKIKLTCIIHFWHNLISVYQRLLSVMCMSLEFSTYIECFNIDKIINFFMKISHFFTNKVWNMDRHLTCFFTDNAVRWGWGTITQYPVSYWYAKSFFQVTSKFAVSAPNMWRKKRLGYTVVVILVSLNWQKKHWISLIDWNCLCSLIHWTMTKMYKIP